jgi:EAL domain-containing protein (putative c-di-GMP-specific phosphodiesterase class I)
VETAVNDLVTLSRNVADKSFAVFYQPVVSLKEDRIAWNERSCVSKGRAMKKVTRNPRAT